MTDIDRFAERDAVCGILGYSLHSARHMMRTSDISVDSADTRVLSASLSLTLNIDLNATLGYCRRFTTPSLCVHCTRVHGVYLTDICLYSLSLFIGNIDIVKPLKRSANYDSHPAPLNN